MNPVCPTDGIGAGCGAVATPPSGGKKTLVVHCEGPRPQAGPLPKCTAQGKMSETPLAATASALGPSPRVTAGCVGTGKPLTPQVTKTIGQVKNDSFLQRDLGLKLNPLAKSLLRKHGSLDVCISAKVTLGKSVLRRESMTVKLR